MKVLTTITICVLTVFAVSITFDTPAEARRVNVTKNFGKGVSNTMRSAGRSVSKATRNVSKGVYRSTRWGARTLWVGTGLGAGAAAATRNCNYYHKRYQETGNTKWRNKYNNCIR